MRRGHPRGERRRRAGSARSRPLITLTTDFGRRDNFVGVMHGVIAGIAPAARVVDLSHAVPPQDVAGGAFVLATGFGYFPAGAIHVAVVDPGVGSARRAIALQAGGYRWVAPDNGLLGYALAGLAQTGRLGGRWEDGEWALPPSALAVELTERRYWLPTISATFHGRDVFAPVAAHLARGVGLTKLGPRIERIRALALPRPERVGSGWRGEVIYVDQFGNLVTNLGGSELVGRDWRVHIGGRDIAGISDCYEAMCDLGAIWGSAGYLEVAARATSAAAQLGAGVGTEVLVAPGLAG